MERCGDVGLRSRWRARTSYDSELEMVLIEGEEAAVEVVLDQEYSSMLTHAADDTITASGLLG